MFPVRWTTCVVGLAIVGAASQPAYGQRPCEQITPTTLAADGVPPVTKLQGASCSFVTQAKWRRQSQPGVLEIIPMQMSEASPADFDKLQSDWLAQHGRRCGQEPGLGKKAAWCATYSVDSMDYQLLILRERTISIVFLHNWITPPNPAEAMAKNVALDVFGPAPEEAPLVRPQ